MFLINAVKGIILIIPIVVVVEILPVPPEAEIIVFRVRSSIVVEQRRVMEEVVLGGEKEVEGKEQQPVIV